MTIAFWTVQREDGLTYSRSFLFLLLSKIYPEPRRGVPDTNGPFLIDMIFAPYLAPFFLKPLSRQRCWFSEDPMPLLHPLSLLLLVHFQPYFELIDFVGESRQERAEDWDLSTPELYRSFPDQTVYQESFSVS